MVADRATFSAVSVVQSPSKLRCEFKTLKIAAQAGSQLHGGDVDSGKGGTDWPTEVPRVFECRGP